MRLSSDLGRSTPRSIARGERCAVCGLAGYLGDPAPEGAERALLERMIHTLAHRGPDGYGLHAEPGVGLAHARLSINDLATGDQPIHNPARTGRPAFNGEIFNFVVQRTVLDARGDRKTGREGQSGTGRVESS